MKRINYHGKGTTAAILTGALPGDPRSGPPKTSKIFSTAAVVSLSSGMLLCNFSEVHEAAEHLMGHQIWTHQFASRALWDQMKARLLEQHPALPVTEPEGVGRDNWQDYLAAACAMFGETMTLNGTTPTGNTGPGEN